MSELKELQSESSATTELAPIGSARLQARGMDKHFGPVQALTNVDLDLYAGQVTCLCGDNGAGKSVLIKMHASERPCDRGTTRRFGPRPRKHR